MVYSLARNCLTHNYHTSRIFLLFRACSAVGARVNRTDEVEGSNPSRSTGFLQYGPMAQLGARLNGIEKVEGSNPSGSTYDEGRSSTPSAREFGQGCNQTSGADRVRENSSATA